jgi:hypothetical protein
MRTRLFWLINKQKGALRAPAPIAAPLHLIHPKKINKNYFMSRIGLGTEFRSEKIPRNRLGTVSVIPRKKALIPRHSESRGRADSEARNGTEWNSAEKISFTKQQQNNLTK